MHEKYFSVLKKEIENYFLENKIDKIKTIYFGGGTPSAVNEEYIGKILEIFKKQFGNIDNIEVLMESNPEDLNGEKGIKKLKKLKEFGITKISIGIQSFQKKFFDFFERKNYEAEKIILNAKKIFPNLSIDLIFGIPNQTEEDLEKDLKMIQKLDLKHISYYALDYKKNSKIQNKKNNPDKNFKPIEFRIVKNYYYQILDFLKKEKFEQYEFYNFCKNQNHNLHNKNFWELENYYGFGLSAVGSNGNKNFINTKNLNKYIEQKYIGFPPSREGQTVEEISGIEKNFLELQKIFHLTRWKNIEEIRKILGFGEKTGKKNNSEIILKNILNSRYIETKELEIVKNSNTKSKKNLIKLNREGIMHFEDFFEEIFS